MSTAELMLQLESNRHHFHPHASMTKHAPESNERHYAVYLPAAHKKKKKKMTGQKTHDTCGR